ncbi:peptidoglycan DD-metalloendopeptidase family protein [Micromonosporaceae bacterium Da 78-11]
MAVCAILLGLTAAPGRAAADPGDAADRAGRTVHRVESVLEDATALARAAAIRLEATTAALPTARTKVAMSRGLVAAALTEANTAGRRANTARTAYAKVAGRLRQAQSQVDASRDRVDQIAQASYKGGNISRINVLVEATGPQDIMDRLGLVEQIMRYQQDEVDTLIVARRTARIAQDRAGRAKLVAEQTEFAARTKLQNAKTAQTAAVRAQQALARLASTRMAALRVANSQRGAVLARYRAAKAEEQRIRSALRGWTNRQGFAAGVRYGGGKLLMPVDGWKSSDYGQRYDPYYRVWQLHAGTDFAAGGGSPIHVAASGRVIQAGWRGGYGNYTCVSHGKIRGTPFSTCYGHQSRILVHVGEYVRRGEVIGRVGTTGASTGYHLHFETRFDGSPRNPLNYLPSCLC